VGEKRKRREEKKREREDALRLNVMDGMVILLIGTDFTQPIPITPSHIHLCVNRV
jgi:hypothetical protein